MDETAREIAGKLSSIKEKQGQIDAIRAERVSLEAALVEEYRVNECNSRRNELAMNEASSIKPLNDEIDALNLEVKALVDAFASQNG